MRSEALNKTIVQESGLERPLRVLFLLRSFSFGGAERQLSLLLPRLVSFGIQPVAAVFYGNGPFEAELRAAGVEVVDLAKTGRWDLLPFLRRWLKLVRAARPDIIVGWMPVENFFASLGALIARRDSRVVWSLRGAQIDESASRLSIRIINRIESALLGWPDAIFSNSHAGLATRGLPLLPPRRAVIENGVRTDHFVPDPERRCDWRAKLGMGDDAPLIGIVGRLAPQKDHRTFFRAAALIAARVENARFLVLGDGPDDFRNDLRSFASTLGLQDRIHWSAATTDVVGALNALDLVVSTSSFGEGTHNVLLEALSIGVPVVSTDIGDAARVAGEYGSVVPAKDHDAVAGAVLRELAGDTPQKHAERRLHADRNYGIEIYVRKAAHMLRQVALL